METGSGDRCIAEDEAVFLEKDGHVGYFCGVFGGVFDEETDLQGHACVGS